MLGVIANFDYTEAEMAQAEKIISELHQEVKGNIDNDFGPFLGAIYNPQGELVAKMPNTVIKDGNCLNHAEMNAIREAQKKLKNYDLSNFDLTLYVNAEPCIMCLGGIMWAGIKKVFYGVETKDVEEILGFYEGFKPNWQQEFAKLGIKAAGSIAVPQGREALAYYLQSNKKVYKPEMQNL